MGEGDLYAPAVESQAIASYNASQHDALTLLAFPAFPTFFSPSSSLSPPLLFFPFPVAPGKILSKQTESVSCVLAGGADSRAFLEAGGARSGSGVADAGRLRGAGGVEVVAGREGRRVESDGRGTVGELDVDPGGETVAVVQRGFSSLTCDDFDSAAGGELAFLIVVDVEAEAETEAAKVPSPSVSPASLFSLGRQSNARDMLLPSFGSTALLHFCTSALAFAVTSGEEADWATLLTVTPILVSCERASRM